MSTLLTIRRSMVLGAACLSVTPLLGQAIEGADARYAVLSIIGDKLTLVGFNPSVGSNLDQNSRRIVPVTSPALDNSALLAVDDAIKRLQPKAATALLASRDPKLFALQDQPLDKPGDAAESVAVVQALLRQVGATRLILVAPHRADARFPLLNTSVGTGRVAGLGVYLDRITELQIRGGSGSQGAGFIAPYAYFSVSLIDAKTLITIRRKLLTESRVVATAESQTEVSPWDVLDNEKKIEMLQMLIRKGIALAIPELLAGT